MTRKRGAQYFLQGLDRPALKDQRVLDALSRVPRHEFVPPDMEEYAYDDRALPIGQGQTISQPYIVALMTQEARVEPGSKVLEIGTGSGFQAAVLASLGAEVFSIEILEELARKAQLNLINLGYKAQIRVGDGWLGWPEEAPFDAILVTASSPGVPPALVEQLRDKGRMVIPLEDCTDYSETLTVVEKDGPAVSSYRLGSVRFVPLTGHARMH